MTGRENIEAALSPEGTSQIPGVICYERIFIRDHWSELTGKPAWESYDPDIDKQSAFFREIIEKTGQDWVRVYPFYSIEDRRNLSIELRGSDTLFGPALEAALREWGYAVVTDQATEGAAVTPLAYSIDPFEAGVLVRLSTLQVELTRMYTLNATGATPASPLSVMQRGSEAAS